VSESPWEAEPIEQVLWDKAQAMLGGPDAFLIIDDTALPKKGEESVGVGSPSPSILGVRPRFEPLVAARTGLALQRAALDGASAPSPFRQLELERRRIHTRSAVVAFSPAG
jgi:hypothetical protein